LAALEQVLLDTSIPPQVRKNAKLFKKKIEKEQILLSNKKITLKGNFTIFAGMDNNANVAPPDVNIDIGTLTDSSTAKKDNYRAASLSLKHYYSFAKPGLSAIKDYKLYWYSTINTILKDYITINNSDLVIVNVTTGPLIRQNKWQYDFKLNADHIMLSSQSLANYYGFTPSVAYHIDDVTLTLKPSYIQRKYLNEYDYDKNGHQHGVELIYSKKNLWGFSFQTAVAIRSLDLNKSYHSYVSSKYSLYVLKQFNSDLSLTAYSSYERSHYAAVEDFYFDKRQDKIWRNILSLKYKVNKAFFVGLKYSSHKRKSNHDLYTYERKRVELHLGYLF